MTEQAKDLKNARSFAIWYWMVFWFITMAWLVNLAFDTGDISHKPLMDRVGYGLAAMIWVASTAGYAVKATLAYIELLLEKHHSR